MKTSRWFHLIFGIFLPLGLVFAPSTRSVQATPRADPSLAFTVNDFRDAGDANPGDGLCLSTLGGSTCTLRAAIDQTNASLGLDTITLPVGTYVLTIAGIDDEGNVSGDLDITDDLTLTGAGAGLTIINGGALDRVL